MGRKVTAFVTAGALVLASVAMAKSYELEGDLGEAHPDSEVTSTVQVRGGVPTQLKTFEFAGLLAECSGDSELEVSGESGRPTKVVRKGTRFKFETELTEGGSTAAVRGRVSRSGKASQGRIEYSEADGDCEAEARFELER